MKKISYFLLFIALVACAPKGAEPIKLNIVDLSQNNNLIHGTKITIQIPFINF